MIRPPGSEQASLPQVSRSRHRVRPDAGPATVGRSVAEGYSTVYRLSRAPQPSSRLSVFHSRPVRSDRCGPPAAAVTFPSRRPSSWPEDLIGGRPVSAGPAHRGAGRRTPVEDDRRRRRKCRGHLPPRRQAGPGRTADRPGPARAGVLRPPARRGRPRPAGQLRHERAPRVAREGDVHRGPHPGDHPGDLRLPPREGDRRPAVHGQGHALPVRPGPADGTGGPRRQRGADGHPARTTG